MKIMAFGFVCNGKRSYLKKFENQFDFFIVTASILT